MLINGVTSYLFINCRKGAICGLNVCQLVSHVLTWQHLLIRHTLDVMHIEKNICENVACTIFSQKNIIKVWHDMQAEGIRHHLWLK